MNFQRKCIAQIWWIVSYLLIFEGGGSYEVVVLSSLLFTHANQSLDTVLFVKQEERVPCGLKNSMVKYSLILEVNRDFRMDSSNPKI